MKISTKNVVKRGRPKGRSVDSRSFGPLGDLIRSNRLAQGLGLQDIADACRCSVQFVSNIEHGRAPLPWDKAELLADTLGVKVEDVRAANLAVRSDFKSFMDSSSGTKKSANMHSSMASSISRSVTGTVKDAQLRELIQRYQSAPMKTRKKFMAAAKELLQ